MSTQTIFKTAGSTSQSTELSLVQKAAATSPGDPITGLAFNTSSLTAFYKINGTGTLTSITLATQTDTGAFSSGGFVETSSTNAPGCYRFDIPNACLATAGECTIVFNGAANMATHTIKVIVTAVDLYDTVRMGLTALPNVASGSAGAVITSGTGTAQLSVASGVAVSNVTTWNGTALTGKTGAIPEFGIVDSGTAQSATGTTLVLRSAAAFADSELIGATIEIVSATTGAGQSRFITANVGSTDTVTVDTWTTTPTGTIVYVVYAGSPASATSVPNVNVSKWNGTTVATPATAGIPDVNTKNINNAAAATPGASGGILISGTNSGTTTLGALTVTGSFTLSDGLLVSRSTTNADAVTFTGNGTGNGCTMKSGTGATGQALNLTAQSTNGSAFVCTGVGSGAGFSTSGGLTGPGMRAIGGGTSGDALSLTCTSGNGITATGGGTSKHGAVFTGGTAGTSDGLKCVAGTGGIDIRGDITKNAMVESYAADGVAPTVAQALLMIQQTIGEVSVSGTTLTAKRIDKATTASTYTLDSATTPTSRTRAT
jgi:hypothetical protein